jgi:hypothetical protein
MLIRYIFVARTSGDFPSKGHRMLGNFMVDFYQSCSQGIALWTFGPHRRMPTGVGTSVQVFVALGSWLLTHSRNRQVRLPLRRKTLINSCNHLPRRSFIPTLTCVASSKSRLINGRARCAVFRFAKHTTTHYNSCEVASLNWVMMMITSLSRTIPRT